MKYHEHLANKLNDPKTAPKTCNDFFAKQCTPITNDSTVPVSINSETRERLSSLEFCVNDIVKVIRSLDQNKAHGHDGISIRMIKLCASSISKPSDFQKLSWNWATPQRMEKSKYNSSP